MEGYNKVNSIFKVIWDLGIMSFSYIKARLCPFNHKMEDELVFVKLHY